MKKSIEKRLSYLYTGELSAVMAFIGVSFLVNYAYPELQLFSLSSFWLSFCLLEFLLLQGTMYWYSKLQVVKKSHSAVTLSKIVILLRKLKNWNIVLIIVTPVAFIIDLLKWDPLPSGGGYVTVFIYIFAILEYINYFHIQLSYDNASDVKNLLTLKRLKKASLSKDFERMHNNNIV